MGSLACTPALADTFQPYVSAGISHVNNLFRLSDDQLRFETDGDDTYRSATGGLRFERPVGRQVFSGVAELTSVKYDRNSQLNYLGKNLAGEWHWFLASHFEGHVGGLYLQELPSFSEFHVIQRSLRITKREYADASWRFHPSWQWRTTYTKDEYSYDLPALRSSNRKDVSVIANIDYLAASGSTIGLQFRRLKDSYPNGQLLDVSIFGDGYVQDEAKVNISWLASGITQVTFLGGYVRRKENSGSAQIDSGTNARLIVNWAPTGRVKVVGQAWREYSPIEGALVNSALNTGSSVGSTWDYSEQIQVLANLKHETRKFTPSSVEGISLVSAFPGDKTNSVSVGLAYKPLRSVILKVTAFRDRRVGSTTIGTNSFKVNGATFTASKQF